jgi:RNA polymerase sigma-70 factor (ECF subfamily)
MELAAILKECKANSITAQKCLYDRYVRLFFLFCRRYLRTNESAEECMMNGFLKIYESLVSFEYQTDAASMAWMKKIMLNECLQELRKKERFILVSEDLAEEIATDHSAIDLMSGEELFKLITKLPIGYRTVFNLYVVEGFKHAEIALELGISEGTSKSQLNKARALLQQMLLAENKEWYVSRRTK